VSSVLHPRIGTRSGSLQTFADASSSVAQIVFNYSGSLRPRPTRFSRPAAVANAVTEH
jgi:hypothetical protein